MGMTLKYTIGDDQTKPGPAVDNATRMIDRDGAIMITGGSSTGTAVAVSGLCQQKKTIKNVLMPLATADFAPALQQPQAAKPDVLVITEFGKDMVNALNQAAQFGLTKTTKILVPLADEYMAKGTGDNFDNVVSTAPFFWKYHAAQY